MRTRDNLANDPAWSNNSAILSSIFLKEKLTFFGKVGCVLCILGSVIIAMNGPSEAAAPTIKEFQKLFLAPGFLAFGSVIIVVSLGLIFWAGPRYGKKNMLVYVSRFFERDSVDVLITHIFI
jgi:hypothetical protein